MLNQDYSDILSAFSEEEVEYLLVGAYALAAYGYVRTTGDIDLWIRPEENNALCVLRALARFGAPISGVTENDFCKPGMVFQIGVAPRRIDLLTTLDGVDFDDAWKEHEKMELGGFTLPVMSRAHLIQNKEATGRPQDKVDADWLRRKLPK